METSPRPQREHEGRRLLALPSLALHPEERIVYAACLPWDEARSILDPFFHDSGEQVRTTALQTLIQLAQYERDHILDVLEIIQAHLHEPNLVCLAILDSLCKLPRGLWRIEHLKSMESLIQGMINAFDASLNSIGALFLLITESRA